MRSASAFVYRAISGHRENPGASPWPPKTRNPPAALPVIPAALAALGAAALAALVSVSPASAQQSCPEWIDPHTKTVQLGPGDDLAAAVRAAASGTTLLIAPGTYKVGTTLHFAVDDVTLRSRTGKAADVILDGRTAAGSALDPAGFTPEIIAVSASRITLADLTLEHARYHGIHAYGAADHTIKRLSMRGLRVLDCGEQLIKVNSNGSDPAWYVDSSALECSWIGFEDNSVMEPMTDGFYTGGIDIHGGQGWTLRGNLFRNIQRDGKILEHAIHMWSKSRGALIEGNRFEDVFRAIGLGMKTAEPNPGLERHYPDKAGDSPYLDFIDAIIRDNVVYDRGGIHLESGMELANVTGVEAYHNTVFATDKPFSSIEYRYPDTKVILGNNLVSHAILKRDGAQGEARGNLENAPAAWFADAAQGDLRLKPGAAAAIDQGAVLPAGKCETDFEGRPRDAKPDIGAYEYRPADAIRGAREPGARPVRDQALSPLNLYRMPGREGDAGSRADGKRIAIPEGKRAPAP
jgi:hypothetical protein